MSEYRKNLEKLNRKYKKRVEKGVTSHATEYSLLWVPEVSMSITVRATKFSKKGKPISWGIYNGSRSCMNKKDGHFYHETQPSERDDNFFKNFRFKKSEDAIKFFRNNFKGIFQLR